MLWVVGWGLSTHLPPLSYTHLSAYEWNPVKSNIPQSVQGRAQWLTPVIPALWEAKAVESRGQEFETILVNIVKPHLY